MFANDTTILTQDSSIESSIQKLQYYLSEITRFKKCKSNGKVKIFTLKKYKDSKNIYIDNEIIQWNIKNDFVKYLGIFLNKKIT